MMTLSRAGAAAAMQGRRRSRVVDLFTQGTFTCGSVRNYQTSATTLAQAAINTRALEDTGDGNGQMLLMEVSRTNTARNSQPDSAGTAWAAALMGAGTITRAAFDGPLGVNTATRIVFDGTSSDARYVQSATAVPSDSAKIAYSFWARGDVGAEQVRVALRQKDGVTNIYSANIPLTATWSRYDVQMDAGVGASNIQIGIACSSPAAAQTIYFSATQIETVSPTVYAPPSSYISVPSSSSVIRGVSLLTVPEVDVPPSFRTDGFMFAICPKVSTTEMAALGTTAGSILGPVFQNGSGGPANQAYVRFRYNGVGVRLECTWPGFSILSPATVTWPRGQLVHVTVRPLVGEATLTGATAGNGTFTTGSPAALPSAGDLYISTFGSSAPQAASVIRWGREIVGL